MSNSAKITQVVGKKPDNYNVPPAPWALDIPGFHQFSMRALYSAFLAPPLALTIYLQTSWSMFPVWMLITLIPSFVVFNLIDSTFKNWAFGESAKVRDSL